MDYYAQVWLNLSAKTAFSLDWHFDEKNPQGDKLAAVVLREATSLAERCKGRAQSYVRVATKQALVVNALENRSFEEQGFTVALVRDKLDREIVQCFDEFRHKYTN